MKERLDLPDLLFGLFLCAVAAVALYATRHLRFGSLADMGSAFMPRVLAVGALGFGVAFAGRSLARPWRGIDPPQLRPLAGVVGAVAAFALLAATAGLAIASLVTILVAAVASREARLGETVVFGVALAAGSVLLFVKLLSLPVPVWPWR